MHYLQLKCVLRKDILHSKCACQDVSIDRRFLRALREVEFLVKDSSLCGKHIFLFFRFTERLVVGNLCFLPLKHCTCDNHGSAETGVRVL